MTPTQRSLACLRQAGYHVAVVEHWNAHARIRQDLFGFADLLAFRFGMPVLLIQTTTAANVSARRKKILGNGIARDWVLAGNELILHGWGLKGSKGERKRWRCDPEWITADQFGQEAET